MLIKGNIAWSRYELNVSSHDALTAHGRPAHSEQITCRCDITVDTQFDEDSWLLELSIYQMEQVSAESMGHRRLPQTPPTHDDAELSRHPFYVVQGKRGAIEKVFYPPDESPDIVNTKKG